VQWSKLKSRIRDFICPELRGRIDFHVTSYRHSHDEAEKCWITVDGQRILTLGWYAYHCKHSDADDQTREQLAIHPPQHLGDAMRAYLDMSVTQALESENPFIRALAIVDRRVGVRSLHAISVDEQDHPLVNAFYRLRISN